MSNKVAATYWQGVCIYDPATFLICSLVHFGNENTTSVHDRVANSQISLTRRWDRDAEGVEGEGNGEWCPPPQPTRGSGPKSILVHFNLERTNLTTRYLVFSDITCVHSKWLKNMRYWDWRQTAKWKVCTNMLVTGDDLNCPIWTYQDTLLPFSFEFCLTTDFCFSLFNNPEIETLNPETRGQHTETPGQTRRVVKPSPRTGLELKWWPLHKLVCSVDLVAILTVNWLFSLNHNFAILESRNFAGF